MVLDACINLTENLKIFVTKAHISNDNLKLNIYLFLKRTIIFAAKIKHYYYCLISWNMPSSYDIKSYEEDNNWKCIFHGPKGTRKHADNIIIRKAFAFILFFQVVSFCSGDNKRKVLVKQCFSMFIVTVTKYNIVFALLFFVGAEVISCLSFVGALQKWPKMKKKNCCVLEKMTLASCSPVGRTYHSFGLVLQHT